MSLTTLLIGRPVANQEAEGRKIGALEGVLHAYTLWLCPGVLALVTLVNLRGTRESGLVFAGPTYVFVASLGFVLAVGAWRG